MKDLGYKGGGNRYDGNEEKMMEKGERKVLENWEEMVREIMEEEWEERDWRWVFIG